MVATFQRTQERIEQGLTHIEDVELLLTLDLGSNPYGNGDRAEVEWAREAGGIMDAVLKALAKANGLVTLYVDGKPLYRERG